MTCVVAGSGCDATCCVAACVVAGTPVVVFAPVVPRGTTLVLVEAVAFWLKA